MPSINRFPPYVIVAAALFMITFYYAYNVRKENSDLERNVKIYSEALSVSKEKNKVLVKDAREKIEKKDARINELEQENLKKHTRLGVTQTKLAKMKEQLALKQEEIKKLHELAIDHKSEITTLSKSVSKSKEVLTKLSVKADHLMLDHTKLKKENTQLQEQNAKLENEIKHHKSEKKTLEDQVDALTKEKQDLREKMKYLQKRNELIQESIKQKIKESYAARRMMTHRKPVSSSVKETKNEEANLRTSPVSAQNITKDEHKDSSKETPPVLVTDSSVVKQNQVSNVTVDNSDNTGNSFSRLVVDNSGKTRHNISKFMVDNRSGTQNNLSKVLVDNSESRKRRNPNSDGFVAKTPTLANNDVLGSEESINASTAQDTPDSAVIDTPQRYSHSLINADKFKSVSITQDQTLTDVPPEIVTSKATSESLNQEDVENLEENGENENVNTQSRIEGERNGKSEADVPEARIGNEKDALPIFPKIQDDTIDRQSIQSQREYGYHLQNNFKQSTVSDEET